MAERWPPVLGAQGPPACDPHPYLLSYNVLVRPTAHSLTSRSMKRVLTFLAVALCISFTSCQCSEKPDVGPVEGEETVSDVQVPISADAPRQYHG